MKGDFFDDLKVGKQGEVLVARALTEKGYIVYDHTNDKYFQNKDIDFTVFTSDKSKHCELEVKNQPTAYRTGNVFIELYNRCNVKRNGDGWLKYCQADWIAFVEPQNNCAHFVKLEEIKAKIDQATLKTVWDGAGYILPIERLMKFDSYYCLSV